MPSILITGASRGLGLEFVEQFVDRRWRVFALARHPDKAQRLQDIAKYHGALLSLHQLDLETLESIEVVARALKGEPIDVLVNNAGVFGPQDQRFGHSDPAAWMKTFKVNAIAPMRLAEALADNVAGSDRKLIVNISSEMGSIADNATGGYYVYRSAKAALNMVTRGLAADLKGRGIAAVAFHPGWVRTDMGGANASLSAEESVTAMADLIDRLGIADSGRFLNRDGEDIPW